MPDLSPYETHVVANQTPEFAPRDLWADDIVLRESVQREGAGASFASPLGASLHDITNAIDDTVSRRVSLIVEFRSGC